MQAEDEYGIFDTDDDDFDILISEIERVEKDYPSWTRKDLIELKKIAELTAIKEMYGRFNSVYKEKFEELTRNVEKIQLNL